MESRSLINLFINEEWEALIDEIMALMSSDSDLPLDSVLFILKETQVFEIVGLCLELLYLRRGDVASELIRHYYATDSLVMKMYMLIVLLTNADLQGYLFGLNCFVDDLDMRPYIRSVLFKDKQKLLLSALVYCEDTVLNQESEQVIKDILRIIPRHIYLNISKYTMDMKIHRLYFQIPPAERSS